MVTYDPNGGYGHPDHVQRPRRHDRRGGCRRFGRTGDYPGEPWTVPKFYWTVLARSAFEAACDALDGDDLLPEWTVPPLEDFPFGYSDEDIDAVVEAGPDARAAKAAALAAHATQVVVGPTGRACAAVEQHGDADPRRTSTMSLSPARRGNAMSAAGRRICSRDSVSTGPLRGRLPNRRAATEGIRMDPDLDPNLQHWQDRLDSLQWVIGSILSNVDSVPT